MNELREIQEIETRLFLEAVSARYGIDLRGYGTRSLSRRIEATLAKAGLPHLGELQHRVLVDPIFFSGVLEDLMVHVSEMFRDPPFYRAFRKKVLPLLTTYPRFRIWHCGCATGEEAYATSILLKEFNLYERCQIYATDISASALERAKEGVYSKDQIELFARNYAESRTPEVTYDESLRQFHSYCTEGYDRFAIKESLRPNIFFFQHNVVSDHSFGEMQVIFCRNVLMYFGTQLRMRVLETFRQSLRPGGFLCLGMGERLSLEREIEGFSEFSIDERIYRYEP